MIEAKSKTKVISYITRILLVLIASGIILYLFPSEGKFKYEYVKGTPWEYDLLVAPFDFPNYKTTQELKIEEDSALRAYAPYYSVDTTVSESVITQLTARYNGRFTVFAAEQNIADSLEQVSLAFFKQAISDVLNMGVISFSEKSRLKIEQTKRLIIVNSEYAQQFNLEEVLDPRTAYELLLEELAESTEYPFLSNFVSQLDVNNYLKANLKYNKELSERQKLALVEDISETSGLVMAGERIIDKGQLVSGVAYKKLESFKKEYVKRVGTQENQTVLIFGKAILVLFFLSALLFFIYLYRPKVYNEYKSLLFIYLNVVVFVGIVSLLHGLPIWVYYMVPITIIPITLRTFFDSRVAIFVNTVSILLMSFMVPNGFEFLLLQFSAGIVGTFGLRTLYKRDQLFRVAFTIVAVYSVIYFGFSLIQEGTVETIDWLTFAWFGVNGGLLLFTYPLIYIEEKLFGYVSDVTLMELSNTNSPLLRQLADKAPGTFQHSTIVANLCQEAAAHIDANPLLARAGAFYHDIGKSVDPINFTENQNNHNPHNSLNEKESAKAIIDHVYQGVKLAKKHRLPQQIVDFILSHHGKGKAKYFYIKYKEKYPDEVINDADFSYPGPAPFSKEMAILMMADAIEASSRSLKEYSEESINNLVEKIIEGQLAEGQFRNAPVSFQDIEVIKQLFKEKLKNIYHTRVAYPEEKKK